MLVLGLESSCDETAAAVVAEEGTILSNIVLSQLEEHRPYGGVVPEIAARSHLDHMDSLVQRALNEAKIDMGALSAIAATGGPGLIGGVMVGVMTAKAIALARNLPFIAVNHLEGHALAARLTEAVNFPYLLLLVSGGHCQLLAVEGVGCYHLYGQTVDDAVGEAFDKVAKLLNLSWPGGPVVEHLAQMGNPNYFSLPRPMYGRPGCDFSFSGLKTAVRFAVEKLPGGKAKEQQKADICAAFQQAVGEVLVDRCGNAIRQFQQDYGSHQGTLVVSGGVAANQVLRHHLRQLCQQTSMRFAAPPLPLCTDNGAMIAWAGIERFRCGLTDGLDFAPRPRWPLEDLSPKLTPAEPF